MSVISLFKHKKCEIGLNKKSAKRVSRLNRYAEESKFESALQLLENMFPNYDFAHLPEKLIFEICETIGELEFIEDYDTELYDLIEYLRLKQAKIKAEKEDAANNLNRFRFSLQMSNRKSLLPRGNRLNRTKEIIPLIMEELDVNYVYDQYVNGYQRTRSQVYSWLIAELSRAHRILKDENND